jgi:hypothetical protein
MTAKLEILKQDLAQLTIRDRTFLADFLLDSLQNEKDRYLDNKDDLWNQYDRLIDLHKFYFENILKAASFSFTIIGAILTFTINSKLSSTQIQIALKFPFLLSIGTCVIFVIGIVKTKQFEEWVKKFQENLFENKSEDTVKWRPHAETLNWMSWLFAILFGILIIAFGFALTNPSILQSMSDAKECLKK